MTADQRVMGSNPAKDSCIVSLMLSLYWLKCLIVHLHNTGDTDPPTIDTLNEGHNRKYLSIKYKGHTFRCLLYFTTV